MRFHDAAATKVRIRDGLRALARAKPDAIDDVAAALFSPDTAYICAHPINQMNGRAELIAKHLRPLKEAMPDLERRDDIFMSGHWQDHDWVSATGYYYGTFTRPWLGLPPSQNWLYVRFGEFYKVKDGTIIDSYTLLDLVDVLRQLDLNPLPRGRGIETLCPGPATQDGLVMTRQDPAESAKSLKLVEAMIYDGLQAYDQQNHASIGMERFWDPDMMWYGPAGVGTTRGLKGFLDYHQYPWQDAFRDYKGGNHKARLADGLYVASTGWPSIRGHHTGDFLGVRAENKPISMRVMDWWRRDGDWLIENWIFVDFLELLMQLGRDVMAEAHALAAKQGKR